MTSQFKENALSRGETGKVWLDSIPRLIGKYSAQWDLEVLSPFNLTYNYIAPAKQKGGKDVVLKICYPSDRGFQAEVDALTHYNGKGAVKLLSVDGNDHVMLLERLLPGESLNSFTNDDEVTRIIAGVMKKLWRPLPSEHGFSTVDRWAQAIPRFRDQFTEHTSPVSFALLNKAEQLFAELLSTSDGLVLVHGDLHHGNILHSEKAGWIAVDPIGVAAEPAYEVAAMIRHPFEKIKTEVDLHPLLQRRLEILAEELSLPMERLVRWCFARTVLAVVWNMENEKGREYLRVAEALDRIS